MSESTADADEGSRSSVAPVRRVDNPPRSQVPDKDLTSVPQLVTFSDLLRAYYKDSTYEGTYPRTRAEFEMRVGRIEDIYFNDKLRYRACALVRHPVDARRGGVLGSWSGRLDKTSLDIVSSWPSTAATVETLAPLLECDELTHQVRNNLTTAEAETILLSIFRVMKSLLSLPPEVFGRTPTPSPEAPKDAVTVNEVRSRASVFQVLEAQVVRLKKAYAVALQRRLRIRYLTGMAIGLVGIVGLAIGISALTPVVLQSSTDVTVGQVRQGAVCLVAGSLGAFVSVLIRLSSAKFSVASTTGGAEVVSLGTLRPFIGAIFGAAFYVLAESGLLPVEIPSDGTAAFFLIGLAFLAGFSERLAPETLKRTADQVSGASSGEVSSGSQSATPDEGAPAADGT